MLQGCGQAWPGTNKRVEPRVRRAQRLEDSENFFVSSPQTVELLVILRSALYAEEVAELGQRALRKGNDVTGELPSPTIDQNASRQ